MDGDGGTASLVELALLGDEAAYLALVTRYKGIVASSVYALAPDLALVDEVCEDAFAEAWRKLATLRSAAAFGGWVRKIARRRALDRLRVRARERAVGGVGGVGPQDDADGPRGGGAPRGAGGLPALERLPAPPDADPARRLARQEVYDRVALEIHRLPRAYRDALGLRCFAGLACKEIAATLGLPVGTVTMQLSRGTRMLRARLGVALKDYLEG